MGAILGIVSTFLFLFLLFMLYRLLCYWSNVSTDLYRLNKLYECTKCKKYHRRYQEFIEEKSNEDYGKTPEWDRFNKKGGKCPHCYHIDTDLVEEEYDWAKYHKDCIQLDKEGLKTFNKTMADLDKLAYETRSIAKFNEMNGLK